MELLSPAGSMDSLKAAALNGADAVYFGTGSFSARRFAGNFEGDELKAALDYCRLGDIKTYITVNTLIFDKEFQRAVEYAAMLYRMGADAVIVQDFGLACEIRRQIPNLDVHASTQMGIHDSNGLLVLEALGVKRAVLSREVPMKELKRLCSATSLDIEVFAHGAMCMSFSGNCLFSSMAGERSGNRGTCAQPCRKRMSAFGVPQENDYALSLSDMCMLEHVEDFKTAGVSCIKLEGRMKRPEYVAIVTRAYRQAIDGASVAEQKQSIAKMMGMFSRGGKRTGYYYGDGGVTGCVAVSDPSPELLDEAAQTLNKERTRTAKISARLKVNEIAFVKISADGIECMAQGKTVEHANKPRPDSAMRYRQQLEKLGGTPFHCAQCAIECDSDAFMPISELNELRRQAVNMLSAKLTQQRPLAVGSVDIKPMLDSNLGQTKVLALVRDYEQAQAVCAAGADYVALEPVSYDDKLIRRLAPIRKKAKLLLALPVCVIDPAETAKIAALLTSELVDGAIASNLGQIRLMDAIEIKIASSAMNILNSVTWACYQRLGFTDFIASEELTKPQLSDILKNGGGVKAYGRTMLMQLKHCPVKEYMGCKNCNGVAGALTDEAGREFPLSNISQADGCLVRVLNCVPTDIIAHLAKLAPPTIALAEFRTEGAAQAGKLVYELKRALNNGGEGYAPNKDTTRGHWSRAID